VNCRRLRRSGLRRLAGHAGISITGAPHRILLTVTGAAHRLRSRAAHHDPTRQARGDHADDYAR
jgi:hypothetical protein